MFNQNLFGDDVAPENQGGKLSENWDYPPFSVLNAREGWWQERKRQWLALGIKSELGRGGCVLFASEQVTEPQPKGLTWNVGFTYKNDKAIR